MLGPAAKYDVAVIGVTRQSGDLIDMDRVHAVGNRVQRPRSPVLDRVEADLTGVQVNRQDKKLTALTGADVNVKVLASDVAAFLEDHPTLEDVQVTFHESEVVAITAHAVIAGFSLASAARIHLRGYLVPQGRSCA
ncbi:MAG: hypothetical protein ABI612_12385 [Betaproteobacteria bacterium]